MNINEFMKMILSDLTVEQFIAVVSGVLISAIFVVIVFFMICGILKLLVDLVCFLLFKDKRLGGWWYKRSVCAYIGRLKNQVIKAPNEKAYYLYYNRLIGAVEALLEFGIIDTRLCLKFTAVPSYAFLTWKEKNDSKQK